MSDLPTIATLKTADGKSTMLQYLVGLIDRKTPDTHGFIQELAPLQAAATSGGLLASFDFAQLSADLQELEKGVSSCGVLLQALQRDNSNNNNSDGSGAVASPEDIASSNTAAQLLTSFAETAPPQLDKIKQQIAALEQTMEKFGKYFGEDVRQGGRSVDIQVVVKCLGTFVRDYEAELRALVERNERRARLAGGGAAPPSGSNSTNNFLSTPLLSNGNAPVPAIAVPPRNSGGYSAPPMPSARQYGSSDQAFEDLL